MWYFSLTRCMPHTAWDHKRSRAGIKPDKYLVVGEYQIFQPWNRIDYLCLHPYFLKLAPQIVPLLRSQQPVDWAAGVHMRIFYVHHLKMFWRAKQYSLEHLVE